MKIRSSFVTNSSSSSFIISVDNVDRDFLLNTVLKEFYTLNEERNWEDYGDVKIEPYDASKLLNGRFHNYSFSIKPKREIEQEHYDYMHIYNFDVSDELCYEIENNCSLRFNFDIVNKVLSEKYNIPWEYGYCD